MDPLGFLKIQLLQNCQKKLKGLFEDIKKLLKRKMRILNNLIVPKKCKRGLWAFSISTQFIKKMKGDPLETKKFEKKSHKAEKGRGKCHSAKKNWKGRTLLGFVFQVRGFWMRSKSSTEYFWEKCIMHKKWYIQGELFGLTKKKN